MEVLVFTPPSKGLMTFNQGGLLSYGVFLGTTHDGKIKVHTPDRAASDVQFDIHHTEDYFCELNGFDHMQLRKKGDKWWKGFIIEVCGRRHEVTRAHLSFPTYEWFLIHYRDETGQERGIALDDPQLKFVGHVEA